MRSIFKLTILALSLCAGLIACNKAEDLPYYEIGTATVLTASATTVAPAAADSNNIALRLNWTNPKYATDSNNVKYTIQIDSAGKNFSRPATKMVMTSSSATFTAKELNTLLLDKGYAFNVPVDMDVRVISSYANNNERINSNTLRIKMTPYKIPPKVVLPTTNKLFIVGSATAGGWTNPVPAPAQELTRINETTFGGIFQLTGGQEYLILPENGIWTKYAVQDNTVAGLNMGGNFGFNVGANFNQNFPGPATTGLYKIMLDFQSGKFEVTPYTQMHGLPSTLFIVGNATAGGWNNPVPTPSQQFTRINSTKFELASVALISGNEYLLLPENGNWGKKYGVQNNTVAGIKLNGTLLPEGQNLPAPDQTGNYKITVDFINNSYTLVKL